MPGSAAIKTFVGTGVGLGGVDSAPWTFTSPVQPVAVGIQAVLDMVLIDIDPILLTDFGGFVPGLAFQLQQFEVILIILMAKQGVGQLVQ
jgi:hypothetical protein